MSSGHNIPRNPPGIGLVGSPSAAVASPLNALGSFVSNTTTPQIADYGLAAGFALIIASAVTPQGQANAAEYQFGTHAQAIHSAEGVKSAVFESVPTPPATVSTQLGTFIGNAGQADHGQLAARLWPAAAPAAITPNPTAPFFSVPPQSEDRATRLIWPAQPAPFQGVIGSAEYHFGTHAVATHLAEGAKSVVFKSATPPPVVVTGPVPKPLWGTQENVDLSISGWTASFTLAPQPSGSATIAVLPQVEDRPIARVWTSVRAGQRTPVIARISASPQAVDLTQQGLIVAPSVQPPPVGPVPPLAYGVPQTDTTQIPAQVWSSVPTPPAILGVTVWPNIVIQPQPDTSVNPSAVWAPSTFSEGLPVVQVPIVYAGGGPAQLRWREDFDLRPLHKKRKEVKKKSPEVLQIVEEIAKGELDLAHALEELEKQLQEERIRQLKLYRELLALEVERNRARAEGLAQDDDEESLLLLLNG